MKERADNVLKGISPEDRLFPFICKIDDKEEVDKPEMWEKANPMFEQPQSEYGSRYLKKCITIFRTSIQPIKPT